MTTTDVFVFSDQILNVGINKTRAHMPKGLEILKISIAYFRPFGFITPKHFYIIWLSNLSILARWPTPQKSHINGV